MTALTPRSRWMPSAVAVTGLAAALLTAVGTTTPAQAAVGCAVKYSVATQWTGGFQGALTMTNTGDPWTSWRLAFTFPSGQSLTQGWGGTWTTGGSPSVTNASYNGSVATGASLELGFLASGTGTGSAPTAFTVNGVTCGGTNPPAPSTTGQPPPSTGSTPPSTTGTPPASGTSTAPTGPPASYPNPGPVSGSTGIHDPGVVKAPDGTYLLLGTGDNLPIKTSTDRVTWRDAGVVWPNGASWTAGYNGNGRTLWAPDISYHNGRFYLYYAASTFGSSTSGIYLATSSTGRSGTWTDQGLVTSTTSSSGYNAIDPNLLVDPAGRWWLTFGSFWSGLKMISLDPATGKQSGTDRALRALASRPTANGAVEAGFVFAHNGQYYLFSSFDLCCQGAASTYRIMVGRSGSPTGPYVDRVGTALTSGGGTQVLAGHGSIHGPGGQSVLADSDADVLVYHYYADNGAPLLGINRIGWDAAGWPFVY